MRVLEFPSFDACVCLCSAVFSVFCLPLLVFTFACPVYQFLADDDEALHRRLGAEGAIPFSPPLTGSVLCPLSPYSVSFSSLLSCFFLALLSSLSLFCSQFLADDDETLNRRLGAEFASLLCVCLCARCVFLFCRFSSFVLCVICSFWPTMTRR